MSPLTLEADEAKSDGTRILKSEWIRVGSYSPGFATIIREQLRRIKALEPNWDRQGARRVKRSIISAARRFAAKLPNDLVRVPAVVPLARGSLEFEWNDGPRTLQFEFESAKTIRYLKWFPAAGVEEEASFPVDDVKTAIQLVRWFGRGYKNV